MKHLPILALIALLFFSCKDNTRDEKALLSDILKVHDKVMMKDEALMKNKSRVDSLLKLPAKDTTEKAALKSIGMKLTAADDTMGSWMNKFQTDMSGKSHDEVIKYYTDQKKQVMAVDSLVNTAISDADKYFSTHK
ncbi:hypothetical protein [Mucilaginibacter ginsenosidivorans]|uniref:Viral A-type inclusion protein n=1 Tax=Mucilaginibacter ginsenosidivorans TaxID=398053 RepID=A0A5B8V0N9_9SPHI|nr:hypothetical protein [Mucilaginibacter ginsenosidivorans]QEC64201.1 hypothetical protein FRZ54_16985 [Mucilaginibacter ginsenosidivorans]